MKTAILIGGFVMSGKTAMRDFLAEVAPTHSPIPIEEFFLLTNPDGLLTLESELTNNWDPFHCDIAIKRFKKLIDDLSNKYRSPYFYKSHLNLTDRFYEISQEFINDLVDFEHRGIWYGINNPLQKFGNKLNRTFKTRIFKFYQKPMYLSFPYQKFDEIARKYMDSLLEAITLKEKDYYVIMEPYISLNVDKVLNFFSSAKAIVVHRDPRDAFINLRKVQTDYFPVADVNHFIKAFESLQVKYETQSRNNPNVLVINFEDFVLQYEKTIEQILDFLNIDKKLHVNKKQFFDPSQSVKNLRTFERYQNKEEIELIEKKLRKYCYKFS